MATAAAAEEGRGVKRETELGGASDQKKRKIDACSHRKCHLNCGSVQPSCTAAVLNGSSQLLLLGRSSGSGSSCSRLGAHRRRRASERDLRFGSGEAGGGVRRETELLRRLRVVRDRGGGRRGSSYALGFGLCRSFGVFFELSDLLSAVVLGFDVVQTQLFVLLIRAGVVPASQEQEMGEWCSKQRGVREEEEEEDEAGQKPLHTRS
jgi:hypothetical protein